jgi:hypothetical protein
MSQISNYPNQILILFKDNTINSVYGDSLGIVKMTRQLKQREA